MTRWRSLTSHDRALESCCHHGNKEKHDFIDMALSGSGFDLGASLVVWGGVLGVGRGRRVLATVESTRESRCHHSATLPGAFGEEGEGLPGCDFWSAHQARALCPHLRAHGTCWQGLWEPRAEQIETSADLSSLPGPSRGETRSPDAAMQGIHTHTHRDTRITVTEYSG